MQSGGRAEHGHLLVWLGWSCPQLRVLTCLQSGVSWAWLRARPPPSGRQRRLPERQSAPPETSLALSV